MLIDSGTSGNIIGAVDPANVTLVSSNAGHGIVLRGTHDNRHPVDARSAWSSTGRRRRAMAATACSSRLAATTT